MKKINYGVFGAKNKSYSNKSPYVAATLMLTHIKRALKHLMLQQDIWRILDKIATI